MRRSTKHKLSKENSDTLLLSVYKALEKQSENSLEIDSIEALLVAKAREKFWVHELHYG